MIEMKDSIGFEWVKNGFKPTGQPIRYKVYLFKCNTCKNTIKSVKSRFHIHTGNCISCSSKITILAAQEVNKKRPFEARYNNFINRVKHENPITDVTYEDYLAFTDTKNCTYCSYDIDWQPYGENTPGFFLDRKDNNLTHIKSNLVVCCGLCNFTKRDEFSFEEFLVIGKAIQEVRKMRSK